MGPLYQILRCTVTGFLRTPEPTELLDGGGKRPPSTARQARGRRDFFVCRNTQIRCLGQRHSRTDGNCLQREICGRQISSVNTYEKPSFPFQKFCGRREIARDFGRAGAFAHLPLDNQDRNGLTHRFGIAKDRLPLQEQIDNGA
jgi:hypothetical protein